MTYADLPADVQAVYADLDDVSKAYPIERFDGLSRNGSYRFVPNKAVVWAITRVNLNDLWQAARSYISDDDMMQVYREMGYTLCGFVEIFEDVLKNKKTCLRRKGSVPNA